MLKNLVGRFEDAYNGNPRTDIMVRRLALASAAFLAVLFLYTAVSRINYPYEIETQEGETFLAALRTIEGKTLYPSPETEPFWVPTILAPLYYYICGFFIRIFGASIWVPRLVSTLAALSICAMIALIARRGGSTKTHGVACGLLFLAFYPVSGQWYDVARVDMTFYALSLGAFVVLDKDELGMKDYILAAAAFILSVYTKQVGVFYVAAACLYLLRFSFFRSFVFGAACALTAAIIGLIYNAKTDGQFLFFIMKVGSAHHLFIDRLLDPRPWIKFAVPAVFALLVGAFAPKKPFKQNRNLHLWLLYLVASLPAGLLPWAKFGGFVNDFIPIFLAFCILLAIVDTPMTRLAIIAQAAMLIYNPADFIPPPEARDIGAKFIAGLAAEKNEIYVENHPYYSWLAKKPVYPKSLYVAEAEMAGRPAPKALADKIRNQEFEKILAGARKPMTEFDRLIQARYKRTGTLDYTDKRLKGLRMIPRYVLTPVQELAAWDFDAGLPEGWTVNNGLWVSPTLPPQCASVSFTIDGNGKPPTIIRLYSGYDIVAQTAGAGDEEPSRIRWDASPCAQKPCHIVTSKPGLLPDGKPALSNLVFEK